MTIHKLHVHCILSSFSVFLSSPDQAKVCVRSEGASPSSTRSPSMPCLNDASAVRTSTPSNDQPTTSRYTCGSRLTTSKALYMYIHVPTLMFVYYRRIPQLRPPLAHKPPCIFSSSSCIGSFVSRISPPPPTVITDHYLYRV